MPNRLKIEVSSNIKLFSLYYFFSDIKFDKDSTIKGQQEEGKEKELPGIGQEGAAVLAQGLLMISSRLFEISG